MTNMVQGQQELRFNGPQSLHGALQICIYQLISMCMGMVLYTVCPLSALSSQQVLFGRDVGRIKSRAVEAIWWGVMSHSQPGRTITTVGNNWCGFTLWAFFTIKFHPSPDWSEIVRAAVEVQDGGYRPASLHTCPPSGAAAGFVSINHMLPKSKCLPWCYSHTSYSVCFSAVPTWAVCFWCCPISPTGRVMVKHTCWWLIH